ncbi:hypothetical protein [Candidatus Nitrospira salsa]
MPIIHLTGKLTISKNENVPFFHFSEALYDRIEAEETLIKKWIDKQLADIRANYDPKVKKLRKKTEIIAHPDVASELL